MGQDRAFPGAFVNSLFAAGILFSLTALVFVLPLLPAISELRRKHDAGPLNVIQQYAGEIRHFAGGFRKCIDALRQPLSECTAQGRIARGKLGDGEEYLLLGCSDDSAFGDAGATQGAICSSVVAAGVDLILPPGLTFLKEFYAGGQLVGGEKTTYRAILGEKDVHIQHASKVMRWAHASGSLRTDTDCDLWGRISSDRDILLQVGCIFQRLNAPRIVLGSSNADLEDSRRSPSGSVEGDSISAQPRSRRLVEGDYEIASGDLIAENIVIRGKLRIGAGAKIFGSVKSNGDLVVETGVIVEGSLIGAAKMHIGPDCQVRGPVIAEHEMTIQSGAQCGSALKPTTVSAPIIDVEEGSLFFGTLWARQQGRVVPKQ